ncbi:Tmem59l-like [Scleropages formosus]|uniref:Tmem59l-like n=1 Tax=Scleropages formosus TaxID=113540 RepID=A0A0N8K132_SCLFO|nr:Tmem59l-like [Scleropages formosus]
MQRRGGGVRAASALVVPVLLAALATASLDPFDNQLGDISYCKQRCDATLGGRSGARDTVLSACHRGCRLFSICQFVNGNGGHNASRDECQGACQEAYVRPAEQEGCLNGCENQPAGAESERRKLKAMMRRSKPLSVMDLLSSWCSDIVSSAQSFISSTWTFYLQADDGKVLVFQLFYTLLTWRRSSPPNTPQSEPQMEFSFPELQTPRVDVVDKAWSVVSSSTQRPRGGERAAPHLQPRRLTLRPLTLAHRDCVCRLTCCCGWRCFPTCAGARERSAARGGAKGRRGANRAEAPPADHDFLGCMSR